MIYQRHELFSEISAHLNWLFQLCCLMLDLIQWYFASSFVVFQNVYLCYLLFQSTKSYFNKIRSPDVQKYQPTNTELLTVWHHLSCLHAHISNHAFHQSSTFSLQTLIIMLIWSSVFSSWSYSVSEWSVFFFYPIWYKLNYIIKPVFY